MLKVTSPINGSKKSRDTTFERVSRTCSILYQRLFGVSGKQVKSTENPFQGTWERMGREEEMNLLRQVHFF